MKPSPRCAPYSVRNKVTPRNVQRRRALLAAAAALAVPRASWAGAQQYEPLADAVRAALSAQIADTRPPVRQFPTIDGRLANLEWMSQMSERLKQKIPDYIARIDFLKTLDYEATRAGLDRQMMLGLIQVESNFRRYAISFAGARGLMQVMPFWTKVIGDGNARELFDMRTNLRYGSIILRHYLDIEKGDVFLSLGRYNGSRGRPEYPNSVLKAWRERWHFDARPLPPPTRIDAVKP